MRGTIANALGVLALPLAQFIALRLLIRNVFGLRIGWGPTLVDADLIIPLIPAFFIYYFCATESTNSRLRLQKGWACLNCLLMLLFLGINSFYFPLLNSLGFNFRILWWMLAVTTLASAFVVFMPLSFYFKNPNRIILVPCVAIALSVVLTKHSLHTLWGWMIHWLADYACPLVQFLVCEPFTCRLVMAPDYSLRVSSQSFAALIGASCAGLDGLVLFLNVSIVFGLMLRKSISFWQWLVVAALGLTLMYLINAIRISLLFTAAVFLRHHPLPFLGVDPEPLFHSGAGWVLYLTFLIVYFTVVLTFFSKRLENPRHKFKTKVLSQAPA